MDYLSRSWLLAVVSILTPLQYGCMELPPKQAERLDLQRLTRVSIGMTREDLVALMGSPVAESRQVPFPEGTYVDPGLLESTLWYAQPGARWGVFGMQPNTSGHEVAFDFRGERLRIARVAVGPDGSSCECRVEACSSEWAAACIAEIRERAAER